MSEDKNWEIIEWALGLDPKALMEYAESKKKAYPKLNERQLDEKIIGFFSRKAGIEGFVTGLPSSLITMAPAAAVDMGYILRCYASLSGVIGYLANEKYFEDPDWKNDSYIIIAGPTFVSRAFREAGITLTKNLTKTIIRKMISKSFLNILKRLLLKWFGIKITQRAIITKTIPIIGGIIGGGWNYIELKMVGKTVIQYHFNEDFV